MRHNKRINQNDSVNQVYAASGLSDDQCLVLACNGGYWIPVSREFEDTTWSKAIEMLAEHLKNLEEPIEIISADKKVAKNFIHHYEVLPQGFGNKLLESYGFNATNKRIKSAQSLSGNQESPGNLSVFGSVPDKANEEAQKQKLMLPI